MSAASLPTWVVSFRLLRDQFLAAYQSGKFRHCHIRLAVPALGNILHNPDRPTRWEWDRQCRQLCDCESDLDPTEHDLSNERLLPTSGPLFGLADSVLEFERLAEMAGNTLPSGGKLYPAIYPRSAVEPSNHFHPIHAWCEFLAVCASTHFRCILEGGEHWDAVPAGFDPGRRHCYLSPRADPFLLSASVIEAEFFTGDINANASRYEADYRRVAALSVGIRLPADAGPAAGRPDRRGVAPARTHTRKEPDPMPSTKTRHPPPRDLLAESEILFIRQLLAAPDGIAAMTSAPPPYDRRPAEPTLFDDVN